MPEQDPIDRNPKGNPKVNPKINKDAYWRANVRLVLSLLAVWFVVSFVFGIILVEQLNQIQFFGFKFGFWWAQQGSIYVFVVLIFIYAWRMHQIDRRFGVDDDSADKDR